MGDRETRNIPMVILLLDRVRRVSVNEARQAVRTELGDAAARTVEAIAENVEEMSYLRWKLGDTPYHLGTSSEPYINAVGEGWVDDQNRLVEPLKWKMREEVPPEGEEFCIAWMAHSAWLYIDALLFRSEADDVHLRNVLRIASHFMDERCVLLWHYGEEPKRVALPSPHALAALRAGEWPT